jgi:NAD(P)-dependent dehydrogenase (short-subunit alcohol dehydrogenase family)
MGLLDGKVAIVTGAGQGIGKGEALSLAAQGAHVIVNDFAPQHADAVVEEIRAAGGSAEANYGDVGSWEGGQALVNQAIAVNGSLDILLCNAGIVRDRMSFNMSEQEWDDVVRIHLKGHFAPTRFASEHWRNRSKATGEPVGGRVIYTTSEAGLYGHEGQANYSAAKAGIVGLALCMARELEPYGVTVNVVSPRARTPMTLTTFGDIEVPEGVFDDAASDNIAPWATFLATGEAADITGQVFVVYGGTVQWMDAWETRGTIVSPRKWDVAELVDRSADLIPGRRAQLAPMPLPDWGHRPGQG